MSDKSTVVIDYRPKAGTMTGQIMKDVYRFMTRFPNMNVEGVSVRSAGLNNKQIEKLLSTEGWGGLKIRTVYEHTQITFMRVEDETS